MSDKALRQRERDKETPTKRHNYVFSYIRLIDVLVEIKDIVIKTKLEPSCRTDAYAMRKGSNTVQF